MRLTILITALCGVPLPALFSTHHGGADIQTIRLIIVKSQQIIRHLIPIQLPRVKQTTKPGCAAIIILLTFFLFVTEIRMHAYHGSRLGSYCTLFLLTKPGPASI
jgi:hypothetical protein